MAVLAAAVAAVAAVAYFARPRGGAARATPAREVFECVRIASVYAALAECPQARKAVLLGDGAGPLRGILERAGVACSSDAAGPVDLVLAAGRRTAEAARAARGALSSDGVWAELLDVDGMSAPVLWRFLKKMDFRTVHLWMPGENDWLVVGRGAGRTRLSDMMEVFSRESAMADLAAARCDSLPCLFAGYVGSRDDVMAAFNGSDAEVHPGDFVTREPAPLSWIDPSDVDADIRDAALGEMRAVQLVRRIVLVGCMQAAKGEEEKSAETWAKAARRNPGDSMLVERLERMSVNAKAFLGLNRPAMAARCYETMAQILPDDPGPVKGYGDCMRLMGRTDVAELAFKRVRELEERKRR